MTYTTISWASLLGAVLAVTATQDPGAGGGAPAVESVPVIQAQPAPPALEVPRAVDLAICLDTSGSMQNLIEAAKQKLWAIVNDLALAEPMPVLRVALLTYGNNGHDPENGWVRVDSGLTEDLDLISQQLFALHTDGGTEYVGRVVQAATDKLAWSTVPGALRILVVAGNESADQDPLVRFTTACKGAIGRDIIVNSIYCGNPADDIAPGWRQVALLADGQFASIDHDHGTVTIVTPFDEQLTALSSAVNDTYVPYGTDGTRGWSNQVAQDANAVGLNSEAAASRAAMKCQALYVCSWDLVTVYKDKQVDLASIPAEELPENMRAMTLEQQVAFLDENGRRRGEIEQQMAELAKQRQDYIDRELASGQNDESRAFDFALRQAIKAQAAARGFRFEEVPAPAPSPEPTGQGTESATPQPAPASQGVAPTPAPAQQGDSATPSQNGGGC